MALSIDLSGKVALVTGAGTGIGVGIAESLAACGADVALVYHASAKGAEETAAKLRASGRRAITIGADLQKVADIDRIVDATVKEFGRIDILINNSGITDPHPPLELTEAQWDQTLDVNLKGMFFCSQRAARVMVEQKINGAIVNLSSVHSARSFMNHTHYAATKAAINHMTRSLAKHFAAYGIRVNAIAPGAVEVERYFRTMPDYNRDEWASRIPLGRIGFPSDIGPTAAFLCSEHTSWLTGQVIFIDGGGIL